MNPTLYTGKFPPSPPPSPGESFPQHQWHQSGASLNSSQSTIPSMPERQAYSSRLKKLHLARNCLPEVIQPPSPTSEAISSAQSKDRSGSIKELVQAVQEQAKAFGGLGWIGDNVKLLTAYHRYGYIDKQDIWDKDTLPDESPPLVDSAEEWHSWVRGYQARLARKKEKGKQKAVVVKQTAPLSREKNGMGNVTIENWRTNIIRSSQSHSELAESQTGLVKRPSIFMVPEAPPEQKRKDSASERPVKGGDSKSPSQLTPNTKQPVKQSQSSSRKKTTARPASKGGLASPFALKSLGSNPKHDPPSLAPSPPYTGTAHTSDPPPNRTPLPLSRSRNPSALKHVIPVPGESHPMGADIPKLIRKRPSIEEVVTKDPLADLFVASSQPEQEDVQGGDGDALSDNNEQRDGDDIRQQMEHGDNHLPSAEHALQPQQSLNIDSNFAAAPQDIFGPHTSSNAFVVPSQHPQLSPGSDHDSRSSYSPYALSGHSQKQSQSQGRNQLQSQSQSQIPSVVPSAVSKQTVPGAPRPCDEPLHTSESLPRVNDSFGVGMISVQPYPEEMSTFYQGNPRPQSVQPLRLSEVFDVEAASLPVQSPSFGGIITSTQAPVQVNPPRENEENESVEGVEPISARMAQEADHVVRSSTPPESQHGSIEPSFASVQASTQENRETRTRSESIERPQSLRIPYQSPQSQPCDASRFGLAPSPEPANNDTDINRDTAPSFAGVMQSTQAPQMAHSPPNSHGHTPSDVDEGISFDGVVTSTQMSAEQNSESLNGLESLNDIRSELAADGSIPDPQTPSNRRKRRRSSEADGDGIRPLKAARTLTPPLTPGNYRTPRANELSDEDDVASMQPVPKRRYQSPITPDSNDNNAAHGSPTTPVINAAHSGAQTPSKNGLGAGRDMTAFFEQEAQRQRSTSKAITPKTLKFPFHTAAQSSNVILANNTSSPGPSTPKNQRLNVSPAFRKVLDSGATPNLGDSPYSSPPSTLPRPIGDIDSPPSTTRPKISRSPVKRSGPGTGSGLVTQSSGPPGMDYNSQFQIEEHFNAINNFLDKDVWAADVDVNLSMSMSMSTDVD